MGEADLLTTAEVAALLRVHPKHVYRLLDQGIPARRIGGKWLFSRDEVLEWGQKRRAREARATEPGSSTSLPEAKESAAAGLPPLLAANGDLAIELLLLRAQEKGLPLLGLVQADRASGLGLLRQKQVLAAGWHGESAWPEGTGWARLHLVDREVGLVSRPGRLANLAEIGRQRLASRPPTAGIRVRLDEVLRREGLDPVAAHQGAQLLASHREVVCAVARGEADLGLATHAWAARVGLTFTSLGWEPYGLVLPVASLGQPEAIRLCESAQSRVFRQGLAEITGYDTSSTGELRFAPAGV